ncbi:MAG: adenylyltransferase/cytidyltransferase family protein [Lachnospiraceae bacterium]
MEQEQNIQHTIEHSFKDAMDKLKNSEDWNMHMTYSPLRESLFSWYDFDKNATLLELNAGKGALTGLFARKCKNVIAVTADEQKHFLEERYHSFENVKIYTNDAFEKSFLSEQVSCYKFDYIIAYHKLNHPNATQIAKWMDMLKENGHILLVEENRYGIKYFCGAKDPYTDIVYDGINNYLEGNSEKGRCYSRKQLVELLELNHAHNYKFYYPVPDSRMPQMIFSDNYQNGINSFERLVDYNYIDKAMTGVEHRILGELIDEGALPFLSNSFVIDIAKNEVSDIDYAVITADRGMKFGCATTIHKGEVVRKRPLWKQGEDNIKKLYENTKDLMEHGIPIIKTELKEDARGLYLSMPYCKHTGLSEVLKKLVVNEKEKFLNIFDDIYTYISKASHVIASNENGEILEKGYIDLAPCNAFYCKEGIIFYDQEFVMENCPLQFAMYRTLKYCYASAKDLENEITLASMYARYGITGKMISQFGMMEQDFIKGLRNTDVYRPMFQWATPDYKKLYDRMKEITCLSFESDKPYHIGYVPGVFDLFHTGHLKLIERCKERCDYLIVGVLTDELVEFYKGKKPVISYEDRAYVINGLEAVDEVIPVDFSNTDKIDAWNQLHYDCHFSGDDHANHWNDVWEELRKRGSNMEFFSYTPGISSTQIKEQMKQIKES